MIVIDLINILGFNPCENNLIINVKNQNPLKSVKGHWKGEKSQQR